MTSLSMGANAPFPDTPADLRIGLPASIDVTALMTYSGGKVRGDGDMLFFNQPDIANGALKLRQASGEAVIHVDPARIPADVEKIVITATLDGAGATFAQVPAFSIQAGDGIALPIDPAGRSEAALILAEIYRRGGGWKIRNVSQGFNGGLAALATHFGIEVAQEEAPAAAAAAASVSLEKKMVSLEKKDPGLVSLVKQVGVSLEKKGVSRDRAKVALVLDISGSMNSLYRSGKIDTLVRRVMALGYRMDDDGEIDVFLFGRKVHDFGSVGIDTYQGTVSRIRAEYPLEGGTRYGDAIARVRAFYAQNNPEGLPVYVMFVTDGGTDDKAKTIREIRAASAEPLFWKFMAIQSGGGLFDRKRFEFLTNLDDLDGRVVDNADAFSLRDPAAPSDAEMFDLMMEEYADWIAAAENQSIL
ncbi:VWA domain-containing protein [Leisingera caerulea]|uniref:VWA domain-containing protein n=1 Tax=Leisingera caerulea TaxID=506591 RepID=UPI000402C694|nr:VWA domain-containing protein [Leisingera caerulea]